MQREFRTLVTSGIRRIAHSPRQVDHIAGILYTRVILVCVAHAALKTWIAGRKASGDPGVDVMAEEKASTNVNGIELCDEDPEVVSAVPTRALWDSFTGRWKCAFVSPAGPCYRQVPAGARTGE